MFTVDPAVINTTTQLHNTQQFIVDCVSTIFKSTTELNTSRVTVVLSGTSTRVVVDSLMMNDNSKAAIMASVVNNLVTMTVNTPSGPGVSNLGLDYVYDEVAQYSVSVNRTIGVVIRPTVMVIASGNVNVSSNASVLSKSLVTQTGAVIYAIAVGNGTVENSNTLTGLASIASGPIESHTFICSRASDLVSIPRVLQEPLRQGKLQGSSVELTSLASFFLSNLLLTIFKDPKSQ